METTIHHAAFRMAETLAICGASDGELSLDPDRITCAACRAICGLTTEPTDEEATP